METLESSRSPEVSLTPFFAALERCAPMRWTGQVSDATGLIIESRGPAVNIGDFCEIHGGDGRRIRTQVIGFRNGRVLSMPLEEAGGFTMGDRVVARSEDAKVTVGPELLGRVLDGFGQPIDAGPPIQEAAFYDLFAPPPSPMDRQHIVQPLETGIRVIDGLLPCGKGQRVGIFGGSGVGKSTLLGTMAKRSSADVNVIALIGERNREVLAFLDHELGPEGRKKSVVVVATSDRPAPLRVRACFVALAIAEYFRDEGASVLLVMDSVTRLAMAQREIGLASGEPPSQKGYTPSVFSLLPKIFERAGNFETGSITGLFTVLVEGDDFNEPICDATRGILDGHIILSRELAAQGHYPAVDVLQSVSRLSSRISSGDDQQAARKLRGALATLQRSQDLIHLGAYAQGSDPKLDAALRQRDQAIAFLRQESECHSGLEQTRAELRNLAAQLP